MPTPSLARALGALLLATLPLALLGCDTYSVNRVTPVDQEYIDWVYYPEQDVYFAPSHRVYWFKDAASNTWVRDDKLPPTVTLRGQTVQVADKSQTPWHKHHEHVAAYRQATGQ